MMQQKHIGTLTVKDVLERRMKIVTNVGQSNESDGEYRTMRNLMLILSNPMMIILITLLLVDITAIMCSLGVSPLMVSPIMMFAAAHILGVLLFLCDEYDEEEKL